MHSRHPVAELALLCQGTARRVVFAVPHRAIRVRQRLAYELDEGRVRHGLDVLRHHMHDKLQRRTRRRRPAHACIRRHQMQKRSPLVVRDGRHAALDDRDEARQERGTYGGMQGTRHAAQGIEDGHERIMHVVRSGSDPHRAQRGPLEFRRRRMRRLFDPRKVHIQGLLLRDTRRARAYQRGQLLQPEHGHGAVIGTQPHRGAQSLIHGGDVRGECVVWQLGDA